MCSPSKSLTYFCVPNPFLVLFKKKLPIKNIFSFSPSPPAGEGVPQRGTDEGKIKIFFNSMTRNVNQKP